MIEWTILLAATAVALLFARRAQLAQRHQRCHDCIAGMCTAHYPRLYAGMKREAPLVNRSRE